MKFRVNPTQFKLLQQRHTAARASVAKQQRERLPIRENDVEEQIKTYLQRRGWTVTRQQSMLATLPYPGKDGKPARMRIGEKGCSDWRAEQPILDGQADARTVAVPHRIFYYEVKRPGEKPDAKQLLYLDRKRFTGTNAEWFDSFDVDEWGGKHAFLPWFKRFYGER